MTALCCCETCLAPGKTATCHRTPKNLECADTSALCRCETCLAGKKRCHATALQIKRRASCRIIDDVQSVPPDFSDGAAQRRQDFLPCVRPCPLFSTGSRIWA